MKLTGERYEILSSKDANVDYWQQDVFPDWAAINLFKTYPIEPAGSGVEPHYHDADEIWLFTPMGVVHRFQMFTPFEHGHCQAEEEDRTSFGGKGRSAAAYRGSSFPAQKTTALFRIRALAVL